MSADDSQSRRSDRESARLTDVPPAKRNETSTPSTRSTQAESPCRRRTCADASKPTPAADAARARAGKGSQRRRKARLWIPQYHGGWMMVIVPPIFGIVEGGFRAAHVPLFALWFVGYFFFYCATTWLRSHGKARYLPPVKAYGVAVVALGAASLICAPYLWPWALVFCPLVAFAGWAAWKREDRSLASGIDTVIAASLMIPVMYDVSTAGASGLRATAHVWTLAALFFGYFAGTILYVKTNIRERGSNAYLAASVAWHVLWTIVASVLAVRGEFGWWHAAAWVVLLARAIAVPAYGRIRRPVSVRAVGLGEIAANLAFILTAF